LEVLKAFVEPPHRFGLAELVERMGLERNQLYRSLKTLEASGLLRQLDGATPASSSELRSPRWARRRRAATASR